MKLYEIIVIGIGLAMDAFAVSVCKGLSMKKINWKKAIIIIGIITLVLSILGVIIGNKFGDKFQNSINEEELK